MHTFTQRAMKFFTMPNLKIIHFKKIFVKEFLASTDGTQGLARTVRWPCEPIILLIGHF